MTVIIGGTVYCPLCEKQMARREILYRGKRCTLFFCRPCEIGIYDFDPAFNKWRDSDKDIPCAHCGFSKVKWFIRYMDGFFKSICPKCKTVMKKDGDVSIKKDGTIFIPGDMEQEETEPPVEIQIPLLALAKRLGKDKFNALKNKLKRKKRLE